MSNTNSTAAAEKMPLQNVETVAGYNHPTGTIAGHYCQRAQAENENKSKYAAMSKTAHANRAALRAAGLDHPDTVEITDRVYDLRTMPDCRRVYFERLARIKSAPLAAVMLKCFECSGYSASESRGCNCRNYALWVLRRNRTVRKQETATAGEE